MRGVNYGMGQAVCPRCGSGADVLTVAELFDMLNSAQDGAMQQAHMRQQTDWETYPDYPNSRHRPTISGPYRNDPDQEIASAVISAALKVAGGAIGKRMRRAYEERIGPALEARAAQVQQQWQQSRADQAAIIERYPDLRGCLRDEVVFLDGGSRSVPISEIRMPVTLAQADALVDRLRAP